MVFLGRAQHRRFPIRGSGFSLIGALCLFVGVLLGYLPRAALALEASRTFDPHQLTYTLPEMENLVKREKSRPGTHLWSGSMGDATVEILLSFRPRPISLVPEDVTAQVGRKFRPANTKDRKARYRFKNQDLVAGKFGVVPYASLCIGNAPERPPVPSRRKVTGDVFVVGGILETETYSVEVYTGPELSDKHREDILKSLKSVIAKCEPEDATWPQKEVMKRWEAVVTDPKVLKGLAPVIRTKHYVIMTNSSAGKVFAKKMEEAYRKIQKIFPFPEIPGRKLMPVFLFRMRGQYIDFCKNSLGWGQEEAERTKGHAFQDYYATYYDSPKDPVHIHEGTHQVFMNRLRLHGGGSWFQEGVAEYVSSTKNQRKSFAKRAAKDEKFIRFRQFVQIPSIINNGFLGAGGSYKQAASIIHFLRDGKWQQEKFDQFLYEMGSIGRSDVTAIEAKLQEIYGVGLDGLEKEWVKYWSRR